jgi:hypothetical protein
MAINNFPENLFENVVTATPLPIVSITGTTYQALAGIHVMMSLYRTDLVTDEQVRLSVDRNSQSDTITSDWFSLSSISNLNESANNYWLGWVRFSFARQNVASSDTLDVSIETNNYAFSSSGTQIACISEYLNGSGAISYTLPGPARVKLYGYRTV